MNIGGIAADTVCGCVIKGKYTSVSIKKENGIVMNQIIFDNGVCVEMPYQNKTGAELSCYTTDSTQIEIQVKNLEGVTLFGSKNRDILSAYDCEGCSFHLDNDDDTSDEIYLNNAEGTNKKNNIVNYGTNDKGLIQFFADGIKKIVNIDATRKK